MNYKEKDKNIQQNKDANEIDLTEKTSSSRNKKKTT